MRHERDIQAPRRLAWREAFRPTPTYALALFAFLTHQLSQKLLSVQVPLLDSYLDPFLAIPLLLGLAAAEQRWLGWRGAKEPFGIVEIVAMTAALALLFEEGFPRIDPARQTRDVWDHVAYAVGGGAYWWFSRKRRPSEAGQT